MKPAKAIEILTPATKTIPGQQQYDFVDAVKLGIEALKRLQNCDKKGNCEYARNLPGED